jgi:hypothetical protein
MKNLKDRIQNRTSDPPTLKRSAATNCDTTYPTFYVTKMILDKLLLHYGFTILTIFLDALCATHLLSGRFKSQNTFSSFRTAPGVYVCSQRKL